MTRVIKPKREQRKLTGIPYSWYVEGTADVHTPLVRFLSTSEGVIRRGHVYIGGAVPKGAEFIVDVIARNNRLTEYSFPVAQGHLDIPGTIPVGLGDRVILVSSVPVSDVWIAFEVMVRL